MVLTSRICDAVGCRRTGRVVTNWQLARGLGVQGRVDGVTDLVAVEIVSAQQRDRQSVKTGSMRLQEPPRLGRRLFERTPDGCANLENAKQGVFVASAKIQRALGAKAERGFHLHRDAGGDGEIAGISASSARTDIAADQFLRGASGQRVAQNMFEVGAGLGAYLARVDLCRPVAGVHGQAPRLADRQGHGADRVT